MFDTTELRELLAKATPGEWRGHDNMHNNHACMVSVFENGTSDGLIDRLTRQDAAFITTAHNDWPAIMDELNACGRRMRNCWIGFQTPAAGRWIEGRK
jgi:hypothetical protein